MFIQLGNDLIYNSDQIKKIQISPENDEETQWGLYINNELVHVYNEKKYAQSVFDHLWKVLNDVDDDI